MTQNICFQTELEPLKPIDIIQQNEKRTWSNYSRVKNNRQYSTQINLVYVNRTDWRVKKKSLKLADRMKLTTILI